MPELRHSVCKSGLGCSDESSVIERKCKECGGKGAPCCWDAESGFTCTGNALECSGSDTGAPATLHFRSLGSDIATHEV